MEVAATMQGMASFLIIAVVVIIAAIGGYLWFLNSSQMQGS